MKAAGIGKRRGGILWVVLASGGALFAQAALPARYTEIVVSPQGEEISFEMVLLPGGTFLMGSPEGEEGRREDEGPQHAVTVAPFYLSATEVTLSLFLAYYQEMVTDKAGGTVPGSDPSPEEGEEVDAVTGPTPVYGDLTLGHGPEYPAMGMSWHNAVNFCKWLSRKTGKVYRLPTEAEWEYACRAGTGSVYGFGEDASALGEFAWYQDNSEGGPHPVGTRKANPWGIYDLLGNVREWVHDYYDPQGYGEEPAPRVNPTGPAQGAVHVARGGDYSSPADRLRCAARDFEEEWWRAADPQIPKSTWWIAMMDFIGMRLARSADPAPTGSSPDRPPAETP